MKQILLLSLSLMLILAACSTQVQITNFEECAAAGNPIMESYPRQCAANGKTFVEEINDDLPIEQEPTQEVSFHVCSDQEKAAEVCTLEFAPTCGLVDNGIRCIQAPCPSLDAKTFSNGCSACAAQAIEYYQGACEDQTFVVCNGEAKTGFDPVEFADNIGGICVDVCPGNYDVFTTQIGIQQCIPSYDKETIESWQTCDRSSDGCSCVNAYETTKNEEITDAQYRCVPQDYEARLIFRAGIDRLDENGEQSVMIA